MRLSIILFGTPVSGVPFFSLMREIALSGLQWTQKETWNGHKTRINSNEYL